MTLDQSDFPTAEQVVSQVQDVSLEELGNPNHRRYLDLVVCLEDFRLLPRSAGLFLETVTGFAKRDGALSLDATLHRVFWKPETEELVLRYVDARARKLRAPISAPRMGLQIRETVLMGGIFRDPFFTPFRPEFLDEP